MYEDMNRVCVKKSSPRLVQFFLLDTFEKYFENNNNFTGWLCEGQLWCSGSSLSLQAWIM